MGENPPDEDGVLDGGDHTHAAATSNTSHPGKAIVYLGEPFESDYIVIPRADLASRAATTSKPCSSKSRR